MSHGLSTGDWGWDAIASGGIAAGSALLAYNFGPAGLDYGRYLANSVLRVASSQIPPIQFGNMSFSPGFMIGSDGLRVGLDLIAGVRIGDFSFSLGGGFYNNESSFIAGSDKASYRYSFGLTYHSGTSSYSLGLNMFSGVNPQNTMMLRYSDNNFSFMYENDHLVGGDEYRTAAFEMSIRAGDVWFTNGIKLSTGFTDSKNIAIVNGQKVINNKEMWDQLAGIEYIGIRYKNQNFQFGTNTELGRHKWQNILVHRLRGIPYIPINPNKKDRFYFNYSNYLPFTLY